MKIYWSLKQITELSGLPWRERNIFFNRFCGKYMLRARPTWWTVATYASFPVVLFTSIIVAGFLPAHLNPSGLTQALAGVVGFFLGMFVHFQFSAHYLARFLREHKSDEIVV